MGTRGTIGIRYNNQDKITYNHFDSYPSSLGITIAEEVRNLDVEKAKEVFKNIIMLDSDRKATKEEIKTVKEWAKEHKEKIIDTSVGEQKESDWYCLLRKTQGTLRFHLAGFPYMRDESVFMADGLFCEWAYIVNLDTEKLEIYQGGISIKRNGRYAELECKDNQGYKGVSLITEIPFGTLRECSDEDIERTMEAIQNGITPYSAEEIISVAEFAQ